MPRARIVRTSPIYRSARVQQLEGLFDVPPAERAEHTLEIAFELPDKWNIGVIVGPSGAGKTTAARELFGESLFSSHEWPADRSILDGFPRGMGIKEVVGLLSSVGFSSPPSWLKPFHVLSNGEQFRVTMARTLAESKGLVVVDEFSSVVDRTVAQIGSAAIAKAVRRASQQFIAVTCHYDVLEWLEPDWVYQPHLNQFTAGRCLRRPPIELTIRRVHPDAWQIFRQHHYLSNMLNHTARCFVAFWNDIPVAFSSWLHLPVPQQTTKAIKKEHRTVTLPDYQGVGIGNALSAYCASVITGMGYRALSATGNPAMIRARNRSKDWAMRRKVGFASKPSATTDSGMAKTMAHTRFTASFEYCGKPLERPLAELLWSAQ